MSKCIIAYYEKLVKGKWRFQGEVEIPHYDTNLAAFYEWDIRGNTFNPIADGRMHPDDMDKVTEKKFTYEDFVEISYFTFKEFFAYILGNGS